MVALGCCQCGFMKGKACLISLIITFYDEMAGKVREGKVVDVVQLDFSKVFHKVTIFH